MSWLLTAWLATVGVALAGPRDDPAAFALGRWARLHESDVFIGASDRSPLGLAWALRSPEALREDYPAELQVVSGQSTWAAPAWTVDPTGRLGLGLYPPVNLGGDVETGWVSARLGLDARAYPGAVELAVQPQLGVDLFDPGERYFSAMGALRDAWLGVRSQAGPHGGIALGAGLRDRWIGPGRHGSLVLSDNARPAPSASVAWDGRVLGQRGLRARADIGAGWLNGDRDDVQHPGWLYMDYRWKPSPLVELGLSRVGIFGGEGRPAPSLGQLILPTDPHVYDDPDRVEPDQDEIAAVDMRLLAPIGRWAGVGSSQGARVDGLDTIEIWWQYGGEDVIARRVLGVPTPALAGVANLYGVEVSAGPLLLTVEQARTLDDYFRWYTGHRVYHDGFTRDGQVMGHEAGGDAISSWGAVAWMVDGRGVEASYEHLRRVGVVEALGDKLLALSTDEISHRVGLRAWGRCAMAPCAARGRWMAGLTVERVQGLDFVPGASGWAWRLTVGG